jgi:hypothetical protein
MTAVIIVTIVFASIVLIIAIISTTILTGIRLRKGGGLSEKDRQHQNEETRMIQEMHSALTKMETRIEALETILFDQFKEDKK